MIDDLREQMAQREVVVQRLEVVNEAAVAQATAHREVRHSTASYLSRNVHSSYTSHPPLLPVEEPLLLRQPGDASCRPALSPTVFCMRRHLNSTPRRQKLVSSSHSKKALTTHLRQGGRVFPGNPVGP